MREILHSKIIGEGTPLLILHGFLGMSDNWKTLGNEFSKKGYEVHLIDQRNHGRSFHSDHFSYELMAEDLLNYMNHHGLQQVNLLGHSMGGKTAMLFATLHPQKVEKLIIADIAPKYYPPHHQDILDGLNALNFNTINSRTEADKELSSYISIKSVRQFLLKNLYWQEKESLGFRFNLKALTKNVNQIGAALPKEAKYNGYTLFLRGSNSDYIQPIDDLVIKNHFPLATTTTITNAGHWLHAENPKMFLDTVLEFLND
ncbi:Pimeloyl-ACP methyl ester carboxylesterase [Zhouia amylolytica]|uniref:Pimeloyl-ACP methyl ester carboxylesterase n=1 Tax=Zhouia amylolytica TaxID=376730 RepID=A0A1I6REV4_9FLAO|nr:alpha/beta fold hydrolase [Zhouia amylolytica]SFS63176.1 Pimeloyl-ACP methyl ester carboxylesterase [Zhouia amylolytica]